MINVKRAHHKLIENAKPYLAFQMICLAECVERDWALIF